MISIRLMGKNKEIVGIVDDNTPVPHTLARITQVSADFGLADEARILYPELVRKKDDGKGASSSKKTEEQGGAAGRAYKERETDEDIIANIGSYVESVASDEEADLAKATAVPKVSRAHAAALEAEAAAHKKAVKAATGGSAGKDNGYILFIRDIARGQGVKGSNGELIKRFDKDWRMLPDDKRAMWKARAKMGRSCEPAPGYSGGRGRGRRIGYSSGSPLSADKERSLFGNAGRVGSGGDYVERSDDDEFN